VSDCWNRSQEYLYNDDYILICIWSCIAMGPNPHAGLGHDERKRLVKAKTEHPI
jgi:hypothetical protein